MYWDRASRPLIGKAGMRMVSWFPPTEERLATVVSAWARLHPEMKSVVNFVEPYGPWPGMAKARGYIAEGKSWVVDIDLEKFFDWVNHGKLMGQIRKRVTDIRRETRSVLRDLDSWIRRRLRCLVWK